MAQRSDKPRVSRNRPVSCHSCRSRKLRCSRQFPCSNCTTRGISCQLYASLGQSSPVINSSRQPDASNVTNTEILTQLRKLEDIVTRPSRNTSPKITNPSESASSKSSKASTYVQPKKQLITNASDWLERECMEQSSSESIYPDNIIFRICSIQQITKSASYSYTNPAGPSSLGDTTRCIWLPYQDEAEVLLSKYLSDITYMHHVVHLPSVRVLVDVLYEGLNQQENVKPGQVALLLSMIASATYSWALGDTSSIFSSVNQANSQCASWIKATLDVLEYSRRKSSGSIEDIQAMIILSFVISNLEGISARHRDLFSTAISSAQELLLHRIDHPSNSGLTIIPAPDSVKAEIGRRVWWYLAATDWMVSRYPGPREGVYTINPLHMVVNKPRNANDEDLFDGMTSVEMPLSQPTSMSYFLQRTRLAELGREFTDRVPLGLSSPDKITYSETIEVDEKFEQFVKEIPAFFCLDGGSLQEIAEADARRAPGIIIQRYILNSLVHAHRCKLHVPYLKRGSFDSTYARSRDICLHAARMIIKAERMLEMEDLPFVSTRLKFSGGIYCVAMATIVLLLDICFNKNAADEEQRKAEVVDACGILEAASEHSTVAATAHKSLLKVLPHYQVFLPDGKGIDMQVPINASLSGEATIGEPVVADQGDGQSLAEQRGSSFDGIWQGFDCGMDIDGLDWDSWLSELDSQFL